MIAVDCKLIVEKHIEAVPTYAVDGSSRRKVATDFSGKKNFAETEFLMLQFVTCAMAPENCILGNAHIRCVESVRKWIETECTQLKHSLLVIT